MWMLWILRPPSWLLSKEKKEISLGLDGSLGGSFKISVTAKKPKLQRSLNDSSKKKSSRRIQFMGLFLGLVDNTVKQ